MSEPIEDCRELNEAEKRCGEFFVAGADASIAFETTEEVFDLVAMAVVAAMECDGVTTGAFWRNADARALATQSVAKSIGVEAFVADRTAAAQADKQRLDGVEIMAVPLGQTKRNGASASLDDCGQLGVDAALGATDCLSCLPPYTP